MKRARSSMKKPVAGWLFLLFFINSLYAQNSYFELLRPIDRSVYQSDFISIAIKMKNDSAQRLEIMNENNEIIAIKKVTPKRQSYCQTINLHYGENRIKVTAFKNDKELSESFATVYYASPVYKRFKYPPTGFKERAFHSAENEKECAKCHDMVSNEKKGVAFEDVTKSSCYGCHKSITSKKYAHAPAVNWLCTSCHDNSSGESRFGYSEAINQNCYSCHKKKKELWMNKRFFHEPFDTGRCNRCHDPHASDDRMFLREPVNYLCTACHAEKSGLAEEKSDSVCPGSGEPSCVRCHDPHASDKGFFLIDKKRVSNE